MKYHLCKSGKLCKLRHVSSFLLTALLFIGSTRAAEQVYPTFEFNAYGTLGAAHSTEDRGDFTGTTGQPKGAGASRDVDFSTDTRLGLQLTATITPKLSAVAQLMSDQQYDNSYTPYFEWANIKYDFTPDFSVRVGRTALPVFIVSDYRKVGYANHWARAPLNVYNLSPVTNNDGVDVSYRLRRGGLINTVDVYAGSKKLHYGGNAGTWEVKRNHGIVDTLEFGDVLLRASFARANVTSSATANALFDGFRQFGPAGIALADRYDVVDNRIEALALGARYDPGNWFAMAEWVRTSSESFIAVDRGWYVTGGYRHGALTPFIMYSNKRGLDEHDSEQGLDLASLPPQARFTAMILNSSLRDLLGSDDSSMLSVGTRWDFRENVNFTVQLDHIDLENGSTGGLKNVQPGFVPGGSFNVFTATVSFVY